MNAEYTGNQITTARKSKGLTQKDLAQRLMVTDKAVSKWERGINYPDIALLKPLSEILGISIYQMICGESSGPEQAIETMAAISQWEQKQLKWKMSGRLWLNIVICVLVIVVQIYVSYMLAQTGVFGVPMASTLGFTSFLGVVIGNCVSLLVTLRRLFRQ